MKTLGFFLVALMSIFFIAMGVRNSSYTLTIGGGILLGYSLAEVKNIQAINFNDLLRFKNRKYPR